ncbi:MAG TPA: mechanosensitive ion channel domain-containing protein [Longimicrobiales bacterium]|nr:mechanosensitive ion channel domain-containing protein [Longimicrobiales bacterium]
MRDARRTRGRARLRRTRTAGAARAGAERRLKRFRRGSALAVAITGFLLILSGAPQEGAGQVADTVASADSAAPDAARSVEEATGTMRQLVLEFTGMLPKILIAIALLIAAAVLVRVLRSLLRRVVGEWERADAVTAMTGIVIWLVAIGVALSVIAGDVRALLGSLGLLGLALSWALQAPIESFAGWLLNSLKGYYRVGDRIAVGEAFGDVYRIDLLTTTVWEAGGPDKPVTGAQPTGALITFPNSEVLRTSVVNYTRGFPYGWDEVVVGITNESDAGYAMRTLADVARRVVGPIMASPIVTYRALLEKEGLAYDIADEPQVYLSTRDAWTDVTIRYLVPARERRKWASALNLAVSEEFANPAHAGRMVASYPVVRIEQER